MTMERYESNSTYLIKSNVMYDKETFGKKIYRFRLMGVPPHHTLKLIKIDPKQFIAEVKRSVQREFKLNPILGIQFIFRGKVLPDQLKFEKIGIHLKKDIITVMSTQGDALRSFCNQIGFLIYRISCLIAN